MNPFIPNKKTLVLALLYIMLILSYVSYIVLGVDLFLGTTIISIEMNRDPLSGALWMICMIIFTPMVGLMTNVCIDGDE